jgi:hypothetical protein
MSEILKMLQEELDKFIKWNDANKTDSEISNARRTGYRQGIEFAIKTIQENW